ncbi:hypothetical protein [Sinomicrobium oceani]|uniref:hypothetical protein n=1 Tax=Sinomicrobium oceani TaxID=1150368 RepID=UPI00227BD42E|nr:hypothetical protein [Sinomicrobium oceani]
MKFTCFIFIFLTVEWGYTQISSTLLKTLENNESYFIKEVDVNKDGILDKVVSSEKYKGNELYFFVNKNGIYELALKSINFSEDGGRIIEEIRKQDKKEVLQILTFFPDGGMDKAIYDVDYKDGDWILTNTRYITKYWQEDYKKTYICDVKQGLLMKELVHTEKAGQIKQIPDSGDRDSHCKVDFEIKKNQRGLLDYNGVYELTGRNECRFKIKLEDNKFDLESNSRKESGAVEVSKENEEIFFLFRVEDSSRNLETKTEFRGEYKDSSILIQNYGNSENPFSQLEECEDKYLVLKRTS